LELLKTVTIREKGIERSQIEKLVQKRTEARSKKDFKESDRIRDELKALGVTLQDSPDGTKWDVVFQ
jgi:cysteinyl-tRNA synthetase